MLRPLFPIAFAAVAATLGATGANAQTGLLITPAELARQLADPAVVVLHVADRRRVFEEGHIPTRFMRVPPDQIAASVRGGRKGGHFHAVSLRPREAPPPRAPRRWKGP